MDRDRKRRSILCQNNLRGARKDCSWRRLYFSRTPPTSRIASNTSATSDRKSHRWQFSLVWHTSASTFAKRTQRQVRKMFRLIARSPCAELFPQCNLIASNSRLSGGQFETPGCRWWKCPDTKRRGQSAPRLHAKLVVSRGSQQQVPSRHPRGGHGPPANVHVTALFTVFHPIVT